MKELPPVPPEEVELSKKEIAYRKMVLEVYREQDRIDIQALKGVPINSKVKHTYPEFKVIIEGLWDYKFSRKSLRELYRSYLKKRIRM